MRVVVHADASARIGTGHVMRCLALGAALRRNGVEVVLAADELVDDLERRLRDHGIDAVARRDAPADPDWVVIDGYHLDPRRRAGLSDPGVPRLVIDDLGADAADATVVLNQNLYATPAGPSHAPTEGELLAGPAYALLRREFVDAAPQRTVPERADSILVTMGGADPSDATSAVIASLAALRSPADVRVLIGPAHPAS